MDKEWDRPANGRCYICHVVLVEVQDTDVEEAQCKPQQQQHQQQPKAPPPGFNWLPWQLQRWQTHGQLGAVEVQEPHIDDVTEQCNSERQQRQTALVAATDSRDLMGVRQQQQQRLQQQAEVQQQQADLQQQLTNLQKRQQHLQRLQGQTERCRQRMVQEQAEMQRLQEQAKMQPSSPAAAWLSEATAESAAAAAAAIADEEWYLEDLRQRQQRLQQVLQQRLQQQQQQQQQPQHQLPLHPELNPWAGLVEQQQPAATALATSGSNSIELQQVVPAVPAVPAVPDPPLPDSIRALPPWQLQAMGNQLDTEDLGRKSPHTHKLN